MSVLKNKRRTSKIEYERNFLGFYEYMNGRIDNMHDELLGGYRITYRYWRIHKDIKRKRKVLRL